MVDEGERAPEFSGTTADGKTVSLGALRGKPLVLYFYPKDDTPVCTKEACSFRDQAGEIRKLGAEVIGVSCDTVERHASFTSKHRLNFPLLADPDGAISKAYGVARLGGVLGGWIPPKRVTFVIDGAGIVRKVIRGELNALVHVDGALAALRDLKGTAAHT